MANHMLRGAVTAWMGLIVLQAVGSAGSGKVASLFNDVNGLVTRALSPDVPLIPDRRNTRGTAIVGPGGKADGSGGYLDPRGRYLPPTDSTIPAPSAGQVHPESYTPPAWSPAPPTLT